MSEELTPGNRVSFTLGESETLLYGVVTNKTSFGVQIKPDYPFHPHLKMLNIKKVEENGSK